MKKLVTTNAFFEQDIAVDKKSMGIFFEYPEAYLRVRDMLYPRTRRVSAPYRALEEGDVRVMFMLINVKTREVILRSLVLTKNCSGDSNVYAQTFQRMMDGSHLTTGDAIVAHTKHMQRIINLRQFPLLICTYRPTETENIGMRIECKGPDIVSYIKENTLTKLKEDCANGVFGAYPEIDFSCQVEEDEPEELDLRDEFEERFDNHPGMKILRGKFPHLFVAGVLFEIAELVNKDEDVQDLINQVFPPK